MDIGGKFSDMQQINHNVARIGSSNKVAQQQTVRHLEVVDAKNTQATTEVIDTAAQNEDMLNRAKGNIINVLA